MNDQKILRYGCRLPHVDGDFICTVRLSITPGDEMLSTKVKTNALFATIFSLNLYFKSIVTLLYAIDKIQYKITSSIEHILCVYATHILPIRNALKFRKAGSAAIKNLPHMIQYAAAQTLCFSTNDFTSRCSAYGFLLVLLHKMKNFE